MSLRAPRRTFNPPVFITALVLLVGFVGFAALAPETARRAFQGSLAFITETFGWFYVFTVAALLAFSLWLAFGPHGQVRLGKDDERPEFTRPAWFSMLFSAGMGIGLLFFGVAEPLTHYAEPARGGPGGTPEAAVEAMATTFFHWGPHAWGIYCCLGAALAYFSFRRGLPLSLRSAFHPLIGDRVHGVLGHAVDVLGVWGTLFGLATSLGFGAMQVNAGLHYLLGVPIDVGIQLLLIALIPGAATLSLVTGLKKGIRILSQTNMALAGTLLAFVFLAGPTLFQLELLSDGIGRFFGTVIERTFWTDSQGDGEWLASWTFFYWGWWLAWAPFVGIFIARISRGRTLREFVLGVLLAPTLVTFVWFGVFGGAGLFAETHGAQLGEVVAEDVSLSLYALLEGYPFASASCALAAVVVALFFVTSSDSGSFVVDVITSGGHPSPPVWQRVFWATTEGVVAAVLLIVGGLKSMQAVAIGTGLPVALFMLATCVGLAKALREEAEEPSTSDGREPPSPTG